MKWMIASDIHGAAQDCARLMDAFERERADRMILLGDLLYHGPRNDLPKTYAPKKVIEMLNAQRDVIFCVRGNCEAEVDQMVLQFPVLSDYALLALGTRTLFLTHGHLYNPETLPPLQPGDLLLYGHTHVPCCTKTPQGIICMNPGSVSLPKQDSWHGYMTLEEDTFLWKDLDGTQQMHLAL